MTLLLLTGIVAISGVLFSWNIEHRTREFFAFYLALIGGVYGVFLSFDLLLLFVFYEIAIIPKYFLIAIWGSTRREYAAMKLALYSFVGSAMVLVGLIAAYVVAGARTMDLVQLSQFPFPLHFQMWAFPLVFLGFGILAGLWPFHTWAPTGHVAAPTAASMLLAGVVMKLGAYGCLRVAMTLFPRGLDAWGFHVLGFGSWRDVFAVLALIGIVYGAMVALVQRDFKFVIGYSSVSHMGFVLLGLMTLQQVGLDGAVLQMFSHGILAGLLFAVVGRMVYDRTHTRDLSELERMDLSKALPFAAVTFVLAGMASIGLPGFSGFVAELQVLIGTWHAFPSFAIVAGLGIVIGIAYTWRAMQKAFFGTPSHSASTPTAQLPPISLPERIGADDPSLRQCGHWTVPAIAFARHRSSFTFAPVRRAVERKRAMITFNYLDLLHLVMPEVIVVIAALCVLSVDLIFLRGSETRLRISVGAMLSLAGCAVAIVWILRASTVCECP